MRSIATINEDVSEFSAFVRVDSAISKHALQSLDQLVDWPLSAGSL